jgi:mRNA interferase YafQ
MAKDTQIWTKCGENSTPNVFKVVPSKAFRKSWKKYSRSGILGLDKLQLVVFNLVNRIELDSKYRDHALQGNMSGFRECHVFSDLLLIYYIDDSLNEVNLIDFGTHSELFG